MTEPQRAALTAFLHSAWITATAFAGGLVTNWYATGMHGSLTDYARANAVGWGVTNLIAPSVRGFLAHRNAALGVDPHVPDTPAT